MLGKDEGARVEKGGRWVLDLLLGYVLPVWLSAPALFPRTFTLYVNHSTLFQFFISVPQFMPCVDLSWPDQPLFRVFEYF